MVAIHCINDIVVQAVKLLQQVQLLLYLKELRVRSDRQTKKLFTSRVGDVFPEKVVKSVLESRIKAWVYLTIFKTISNT